MKTFPRYEQFEPYLVYHEDTGILQAIFRDAAADVVTVESRFEVLVNSNPASSHEPIVGFNLYGVLGILYNAGRYHQKSITLQMLVQLFDKGILMPYGTGVFGSYGDEVYELAHKHNLVWKIPK